MPIGGCMAAGENWPDLDLAVWAIPEKTDQCCLREIHSPVGGIRPGVEVAG